MLSKLLIQKHRIFIRSLILFICISGLAAKSNFAATVAVVYGDWDDRLQYYELSKQTASKIKDNLAYIKEIATSVCFITKKSNTLPTTAGKTKLYLYGTLSQSVLNSNPSNTVKTVCNDMKFAKEYVVKYAGTGTLIDNSKIITADHVFAETTDPLVCIFNYYKTAESDFPVLWEDAAKTKPYVLINTADIYNITTTTSTSYPHNVKPYAAPYASFRKYDWAVLTLDRNPLSTQKRMCYYQYNDILSKIGVNSFELWTLGHPKGLPMIYTDDAHLKSSTEFFIDMDVYAGNSGGPVMMVKNTSTSAYSYKILGVFSSGFEDYTVKDGKTNEIDCRCFSDVSMKPTTLMSYIGISFIDDIFSWGISSNNCNTIPWVTPLPPPPPPPPQQPVPGQAPKISYTASTPGTYVCELFYKQNGVSIKKITVSISVSSTISFTFPFLAGNTYYTWNVVKLNATGIQKSGEGVTNYSTIGYIGNTISTNIKAYAFVGKAPEHPYKTIQSAINSVAAGTVLHIAKGVYYENLVITKAITLMAEQYGVFLISTSSTPAISVRSSNVSIQNMYVQNSEFTGTGIGLENVSGCVIKNNFLSGYNPPIKLSGSTSNTIEANFVYGPSTNYGIEVNASSGNTIKNNIVDYGWGIITYINTTAASNTVSGNSLNNLRMQNTVVITPIIDLLLQ